MDILIQFLRDLLASGQAGIVIIALLVFIGGAIFVIWSQRQALARIELNMKAADTARQQLQITIEKQYDFVLKTNDELRKELERYKGDQIKFENDVRKALTLGFNEVKVSLANITVSEIINQIPEKFKKDLEKETEQATEQAIQSLVERLKKSETIENELFNNKELERVFGEIIERTIHTAIDDFGREFYNSPARNTIYQIMYALMRDLFDITEYDYSMRSLYDRNPRLTLVKMNDRFLDSVANVVMNDRFIDAIADKVVHKIRREIK